MLLIMASLLESVSLMLSVMLSSPLLMVMVSQTTGQGSRDISTT